MFDIKVAGQLRKSINCSPHSYRLLPGLFVLQSILRELVNYRHPDPRRVWKGGSGRQFTTPLNADPADPAACAKLVFRVRETLLLTPEAEFVCI